MLNYKDAVLLVLHKVNRKLFFVLGGRGDAQQVAKINVRMHKNILLTGFYTTIAKYTLKNIFSANNKEMKNS